MLLEELLIQKLKSYSLKLCTVESCTGGLIGQRLSQVPGASQVYWGSFVTYHNFFKVELGLAQRTLDRFGAVSHEVACGLAQAGLEKMSQVSQTKENCICISCTGIAGPTGGSLEKPVGLVYIGLASSCFGQFLLESYAFRSQFKLGSNPMNCRILRQKSFAQESLQVLANYLKIAVQGINGPTNEASRNLHPKN